MTCVCVCAGTKSVCEGGAITRFHDVTGRAGRDVIEHVNQRGSGRGQGSLVSRVW